MERAFWDVVRDQLKNGDDDMLLPMIREIREQILNFLAPNSATKERIEGQIDMELIEQQYVAGCLDYKVIKPLSAACLLIVSTLGVVWRDHFFAGSIVFPSA